MKQFLTLCFLWISALSFGQETDPEVGLVLSGGGAKGLAHIGALKVLEEAGVEVDYIGGTSMGAIVGALYAAGYTADQLDSLFQKTNFNMLIQDELPRKAKTFYERRDSERYAVTLPFDNLKVSFPSALSRGQNVYNLMSKLTLHLKDKRNFSNLPIPFFAVATDVETGEEVILDKGYLPQAVSASAAIPTLFSPVQIDGRLLTDGGVVNNYPVEELRRRGADIIIGVDVQDSLASRKNLKSVFEILTQVNNFRTIKDMKEKIPLTDVLIEPEIKPYGIMSFDKGADIIAAGERAARQHIEELEAIASRQDTSAKEKLLIKSVDSLYIADVRIEGETSYPRAYILGKLKLKYPSRISYNDLHIGINNLSATKNFNRINYQLLPINKGFVLSLQLEENPSKTLLRLGVHYDNLYKSGALLNLTQKSLLVTNDVASLDIVVGDNFRYNFNYYIDKGFYWSLGLTSRYNSFGTGVDFDFTLENARTLQNTIMQLEIDYEDLTNQFYIETLFQKVFALGAGVEHKYLEITSETLGVNEESTAGVFDKSHYYSGFGFLTLDSYNDKYFPTSGFYFNGDFHWYLLSSDFQDNFSPFSIAKGEIGFAFEPINNVATRLSSEAGFRIGNSRNNVFDFFLGGYGNQFINNFVSFYGYDFVGLTGDSFIKGLIEIDFNFYKNHHLIASGNYANVGNELYGTGEWFSSPKYSGYALGYSVDTFLGPMEVKYTISPELKESLWFFSIGFWF